MFYVLHYSIPGVGLSIDISQWPVYDTLSNFTAITMLGAQNQYLFSFGTRHAGDSTDTFKRSCHLMGWKINICKYARVIWHLLKTDLISNIDQCYIWTSQFTSIVVARYQYALAPPMGMFLPIKQTPKTEFPQLCIGIESFATFRIVWISTKIYIAVSYQICRITEVLVPRRNYLQNRMSPGVVSCLCKCIQIQQMHINCALQTTLNLCQYC